MKVAKSGWVRIEQGLWEKFFGDDKYELHLFVRPLSNETDEVYAQLQHKHFWSLYHKRTTSNRHPTIDSPVFGVEDTKGTYEYLVRKYVKRAHQWANEQFETPMDRLAQALQVK